MTNILNLALHAAQLKRIPRMGWLMRGAPLGGQPENVAAHSYGVVFLTMLLLDLDEEELDRDLALRMAVLHDLAESLIGDLPKMATHFISRTAKHAAEREAMSEILQQTPFATDYLQLWESYNAAQRAEAQIVKDADKLDMMIQAYLYEQAGQRNLQDFWENCSAEAFYTPVARSLFAELLDLRGQLSYPWPK